MEGIFVFDIIFERTGDSLKKIYFLIKLVLKRYVDGHMTSELNSPKANTDGRLCSKQVKYFLHTSIVF